MSYIFFLELTDGDFQELYSIAPDAAILTSMEHSDTDTASECEPEDRLELPEPLPAIYDPTLGHQTPVDISEKCEEAYLNMKKKTSTLTGVRDLKPPQENRQSPKTGTLTGQEGLPVQHFIEYVRMTI